MRKYLVWAWASLAACGGGSVLTNPLIETVSPLEIPGGVATNITVNGNQFAPDAEILLNSSPVFTRVVSEETLEGQLPAHRKGTLQIDVRQGSRIIIGPAITVLNSTPVIELNGVSTASVGQTVIIDVTVSDFDGDRLTVFAPTLPVGADLAPDASSVRFVPTAAGMNRIELFVSDGTDEVTAAHDIDVTET